MKLESELKHNGVHEANIKSSRTVRGQMLEAEAEDKILASRTAWPRGLNITVLIYYVFVNSRETRNKEIACVREIYTVWRTGWRVRRSRHQSRIFSIGLRNRNPQLSIVSHLGDLDISPMYWRKYLRTNAARCARVFRHDLVLFAALRLASFFFPFHLSELSLVRRWPS